MVRNLHGKGDAILPFSILEPITIGGLIHFRTVFYSKSKTSFRRKLGQQTYSTILWVGFEDCVYNCPKWIPLNHQQHLWEFVFMGYETPNKKSPARETWTCGKKHLLPNFAPLLMHWLRSKFEHLLSSVGWCSPIHFDIATKHDHGRGQEKKRERKACLSPYPHAPFIFKSTYSSTHARTKKKKGKNEKKIKKHD